MATESKLIPLNAVVTAIRSTSEPRALNSKARAERCVVLKTPLALCCASSASRVKTLPISPSAESAIARDEIPSFAFRIATVAILVCARKLSAIASPAASSEALFMR